MSAPTIEVFGKGGVVFAFIILKGGSANDATVGRTQRIVAKALEREGSPLSRTKIVEDIVARQHGTRVLVVMPGEGSCKVADLARVLKLCWPRVRPRFFTTARGQHLREALTTRTSLLAMG